MRLAVKHAVAATVVGASIIAVTAASYFALFAWAVMLGEPLGGPLAFPFMIVLAVAASTISIVAVLFPATVLTDWICAGRQIRLPWQIPIAAAVMGAWLLTLTMIAGAARGDMVGSTAVSTGIVFLLLLVPLGLYWWSMQTADWILGATMRWMGRTRPAPTSSLDRDAG